MTSRMTALLPFLVPLLIVACASAQHVPATPSESAADAPVRVSAPPAVVKVSVVPPTPDWVRDAAAEKTERWAHAVLVHRVTKARVFVRAEREVGLTPAHIVQREGMRRVTSGARPSGYAEAADKAWADFSFVFGPRPPMMGRVLAFRDFDHPGWIVIVMGSWTAEHHEQMDFEMDGIAAYARYAP
jgi:hypothetical protein